MQPQEKLLQYISVANYKMHFWLQGLPDPGVWQHVDCEMCQNMLKPHDVFTNGQAKIALLSDFNAVQDAWDSDSGQNLW